MGEIVWYDVNFPDWNLTVTIPMPDLAVINDLFDTKPHFYEGLHKEYAEAYIQDYQVRALDALAHTLLTNGIQMTEVRDVLDFRFGPLLKEAVSCANDHWHILLKSIEEE